MCVQTEFNDHYLLYSLCTNCHWDAQSIQCSFYKYKFILVWWLLIVLNYTEFKFSSSANSTTSCHYCVVALSAALIIIINNITLLISYNYSSAENVLSTVDKLKMTVKILCCWAERLNISMFVVLLASSSYLHQLHSHSSLHHYSEQ